MSQRFFTGRLALMQFVQECTLLSRSPSATLQKTGSFPSRTESHHEPRPLLIARLPLLNFGALLRKWCHVCQALRINEGAQALRITTGFTPLFLLLFGGEASHLWRKPCSASCLHFTSITCFLQRWLYLCRHAFSRFACPLFLPHTLTEPLPESK